MASEPMKRSYHSPARERQAEETRQRILDAARALLAHESYADMTVEAIAIAASVSPKTVVAVFGSKRGILAAIVNPATFGADYQKGLEQLRAEPDSAGRVALISRLTRRIYEHYSSEFELLRGADSLGAELAELSQQVEARRREYQTRFVAYLDDQGRLRRGVDRSQAVDELWTLTSYDLYRRLVAECGWSPQRYESWLVAVLLQRLVESV